MSSPLTHPCPLLQSKDWDGGGEGEGTIWKHTPTDTHILVLNWHNEEHSLTTSI